jgi:hypothetical protein
MELSTKQFMVGIIPANYFLWTSDFGTCSVTGTGNTLTTSGSDKIATFIVNGNFVCDVPAVGPANVKTYKGLAAASVKTCKGLAIASVKTKKGLA